MAAVPAAECQFEAPPRLTPVGFMQLCVPWITFLSSLGWAALCDRLGEYKRVLVVSNSVGAAAICCLLLGPVHTHFAGVCACMFAGSAFLASRTGVVDALTLRVVRDYEEARAQGRSEAAGGELPSYGPQRLWGAAGYGIFGLLSGVGADAFGDGAMFVLFGACLATTVLIVASQLPSRGAVKPAGARAAGSQSPGGGPRSRFRMAWFFANLVVYGMHTSLIESFLFVYASRDFPGASRGLLGASVAIMCVSELPVFFYDRRFLDRFCVTSLLTSCELVLAMELLAYSAVPRGAPWLILLIAPLHGVTMAAAWSCSVEFGRQLAPPGAEARVQALVSGVYYRVAQGLGACAWGVLTRPPPAGCGFSAMYAAAGGTILLWAVVWNAGWALHALAVRGVSGRTAPGPLGDALLRG
ncbi:unnamed protein product [Prorocentrum cordatum]|uniref:Major facilitator superfamily associated domain-containing protein n=1 Tax=Prorocentrum cordatum TaxID=2364126 RepID=A0ABN9WQZ6_9DINO|nr:unnamed protein product [Polarella glacialis]